jgi:acetyl-CoA carboxylase carboxyl transferase subunit alpha
VRAVRVLILENAYYSVISPEGCAAILWKDRSASPKAAEALKITANHLRELKLVDDVVPEPLGGAHNDATATAVSLKTALLRHLAELKEMSVADRLRSRYGKFRAFGHVTEPPSPMTAAMMGTSNSIISRKLTAMASPMWRCSEPMPG